MDPKPGYTTTEFWSTMLLHMFSGVAVLASLFTHTPFDARGLQPLIPVAALVMSGIAQAYYSHSRAHVKDSANQSATGVLVAQANLAAQPSLAVAAQIPVPPAADTGFATTSL